MGYEETPDEKLSGWPRAIGMLMVGAPAIGGFVVVAQMIRQYGLCSRILDAGV
jgi:hypothetical protein